MHNKISILFFLLVLSSTVSAQQAHDKDIESKLNYCAYENSLLDAENDKLKLFTSRQHKEIMNLKMKIFEYQSDIHRYQVDSINISKAPIALVKLADYLRSEKNYDQAAATYKLLIDIYPNYKEADLARTAIREMGHWMGKK